MFSYLHKYHAGNFADVHKHIVLVALVEYLKQKPKPFAVLDAFAGEGLYDLKTKEAQLNKEHKAGVEALFGVASKDPLLKNYIDLIKQHNQEDVTSLHFYPGSPSIITSLLREDDTAILVENHPSSFEALKSNFTRNNKVKLHKRDAFESINALLPFPQKRGLVFLDPSYEVKTDYTTITKALEHAYTKMSHAVFAIWYPILSEGLHRSLIKSVQKGPYKNVYVEEWRPYPDKTNGLLGSGMIIINKGWHIEHQIREAFNILNKTCFQGGEHKARIIRET